ncbi:MAG: nitrous oxide-stimulated promoter family protein [Syntrophobacterales bacterium]|nr:nitrous oxide-stimulated promoter family protein [Syntrophobacterales bacterium]
MKSLDKEVKTVKLMIGLYCRGRHGAKEPCESCRELAGYAEARIRGCRYKEKKPACSQCPIHCYKKEMRGRITEVMRFAGPRMTWRHPVLAFQHLTGRKGSYER